MSGKHISIESIQRKLQDIQLTYAEKLKLIEMLKLMIENNNIQIKIIEENKKSKDKK